MPQLDLGHVARDPRFSEKLTVIRRQQVLVNGVASTQNTTIIAYGTVTMDRSDMETGEDRRDMPKRIMCVTSFKLRGPTEQGAMEYMPDLLLWHGDYYVVDELDDYSGWGHGFVQAKLSSIDFVDQAPQNPVKWAFS